MTMTRTQKAYELEPDDKVVLLAAFLDDLLRTARPANAAQAMAGWMFAMYCYEERPENGMGVLLGYGIGLCSDDDQRDRVLEAYLWLSNDGHPL